MGMFNGWTFGAKPPNVQTTPLSVKPPINGGTKVKAPAKQGASPLRITGKCTSCGNR